MAAVCCCWPVPAPARLSGGVEGHLPPLPRARAHRPSHRCSYVGCMAGYQCRIWVPTFQGIFTIPEISSVIGHEQGHNNYYMHAARNATGWDEYGGEGQGRDGPAGMRAGCCACTLSLDPPPGKQTTPASWATTGWGSTGSTW